MDVVLSIFITPQPTTAPINRPQTHTFCPVLGIGRWTLDLGLWTIANSQNPIPNSQHPTANTQHPIANNQQPANSQKPTSNSQYPTANMLSIHLLPLLVAMFLAINMGGSGTAPSFSAAYGANLIRRDLIPGLFGIFVFAGAIIAGKKVILTVGGDILPSEHVTLTLTVIVLASVSLSLFFANMLRVPQSTSQSTIFALAGPAIYLDVLQTKRLFLEIIPTWFITPILAFSIAFIVGWFLTNRTTIPHPTANSQ